MDFYVDHLANLEDISEIRDKIMKHTVEALEEASESSSIVVSY